MPESPAYVVEYKKIEHRDVDPLDVDTKDAICVLGETSWTPKGKPRIVSCRLLYAVMDKDGVPFVPQYKIGPCKLGFAPGYKGNYGRNWANNAGTTEPLSAKFGVTIQFTPPTDEKVIAAVPKLFGQSVEDMAERLKKSRMHMQKLLRAHAQAHFDVVHDQMSLPEEERFPERSLVVCDYEANWGEALTQMQDSPEGGEYASMDAADPAIRENEAIVTKARSMFAQIASKVISIGEDYDTKEKCYNIKAKHAVWEATKQKAEELRRIGKLKSEAEKARKRLEAMGSKAKKLPKTHEDKIAAAYKAPDVISGEGVTIDDRIANSGIVETPLTIYAPRKVDGKMQMVNVVGANAIREDQRIVKGGDCVTLVFTPTPYSTPSGKGITNHAAGLTVWCRSQERDFGGSKNLDMAAPVREGAFNLDALEDDEELTAMPKKFEARDDDDDEGEGTAQDDSNDNEAGAGSKRGASDSAANGTKASKKRGSVIAHEQEEDEDEGEGEGAMAE